MPKYRRDTDESPQEGLDLGKPTHILRKRYQSKDGREHWNNYSIWCPKCLARRDPSTESRKYIGGFLWTWTMEANAEGVPCKRHNKLLACTCALGQYRRRRRAESNHRPVEEVPDGSFFPPEAVIGPYDAEDAKDPNCDCVVITPAGG